MDAAVDGATPAPLDQVSPTRKLQAEEETSTTPPQLASDSSPTSDAKSGDGCPGIDTHQKSRDGECPAGQIMCSFFLDEFSFNHYYCHVL